jgi:hypothetical protein
MLIPDPGCQKATEYFDSIPEDGGEEYLLLLAAIETHKQQTTKHDPECFTQRAIN